MRAPDRNPAAHHCCRLDAEPRRWTLIAITFAGVHCGYKPEVLHHLPCDSDSACTSSGGPDSAESSESSGNPEATTVSTTIDPVTTIDPAASDGSSEATSSSSESSSGVVDESSSTGDPVDDMYAPCDADDQCTSGYCAAGFCTALCWTQVDGDIPCPPPPGDAVGVTITCGRIDSAPPGGGLCEGCFDCAQYCVAVCDGGSVCPNGSTCVDDPCGAPDDHCN
jgi:hypothetical protein